MKFTIADEVFAKLPDVCFGFVYATGIDNTGNSTEIGALLDQSIRGVEERFGESKVKEAPELKCYREAFTTLGINPNKFLSSIEAMVTRISKGKGFPHINSVVDLGNAISLKYLVPLGAHDVDSASGDIQVRFSKAGDHFIPFGEGGAEILDDGELIYAVREEVKTRRWIWRQSEIGKVTEKSRNIFLPIDGFILNKEQVLGARDELAHLLQKFFGCKVKVGFLDKEHREELF